MLNRADWKRLKEIRETMNDLLEEADNLVRLSGNKFEYNRANSYWLNGMENYLGTYSPLCGCTMEETINSIKPLDYEEENEDTE